MTSEDRFATARYIAFEGIEGAGKSTIAQRVADHLEAAGREVVVVREPGGTDVGEGIRHILLTADHEVAPRAEAALFAASRAQLVTEIVRPALERGAWVLSDRTAYSSLAYQGGGRELDINEVFELNDVALGGLWPDAVVLLRLEVATGLARQQEGDRIGNEAEAFHQRVANAFDQMAESEAERFLVVDASRSVDVVVAAVIEGLGL